MNREPLIEFEPVDVDDLPEDLRAVAGKLQELLQKDGKKWKLRHDTAHDCLDVLDEHGQLVASLATTDFRQRPQVPQLPISALREVARNLRRRSRQGLVESERTHHLDPADRGRAEAAKRKRERKRQARLNRER